MNITKLRKLINASSFIHPISHYLRAKITSPSPEHFDSSQYWNNRYKLGGNSGDGSYGKLAAFKAEIINEFVKANRVKTIIEFGCGDGSQLCLAEYPTYVGFDVSTVAIELCKNKLGEDPNKKFLMLNHFSGESAELTLSLDVIYHLVEHDVFNSYMHMLFDASTRYVIVYSSNTQDNEEEKAPHVKHRRFTNWVKQHKPHWKLIAFVPNRYPFNGDGKASSHSDFYIFERN